MKILIVAATQLELNPVQEVLNEIDRHKLSYLVTGVGMTATAFHLGRAISNEYDLAINIGLAGAFDRSIALGEVVNVIQDHCSEEGVQDGDEFLNLEEIGLRKGDEFPFIDGHLKSSFNSPIQLKELRGITVNTVHGNENSIRKVTQRLHPEVESMEGAAFMYACNVQKLPCLQIRAISNYVEKRDRNSWKIDLALNNLAKETYSLIKQL